VTKKEAKCECGSSLPMHLVDMLSSHVCSCERKYVPRDGVFVFVGTEINPFARYDREQMRKSQS